MTHAKQDGSVPDRRKGDSLVQAVEASGLRMTPQRRAICGFLDGNTDHPSAADIYRALEPTHPSLSLATVYNTLEALKARGLILELAFDDGNRYDPDTRLHVNVVCRECGRIHDVPGDRTPLGAMGDAVGRASGYRLDPHQEILYQGVCPECDGESNGPQ